MSKYKVGDRVKIISSTRSAGTSTRQRIGRSFEILEVDNSGFRIDSDCSWQWWYADSDAQLINNEGGAPMARKTYKLLKDTPLAAKGALYQEACDDGTQEYVLINKETHYKDDQSKRPAIVDRSLVEDAPSWFVEVFPVTPPYLTQAELDQWEAFKTQKPAKKTVAKKIGRPAKAKAA